MATEITTIQEGQTVPNFSFTATTIGHTQLSDFSTQTVILYFYPKDNTPGCTQEGIDFSQSHDQFKQRNAVIFGVSKDSLKKHQNFKGKHHFPFELISDADGSICELFNVIKEKSMFGKKYLGIERSTFIISPNNQLKKIWRKVKVANHVMEVLHSL